MTHAITTLAATWWSWIAPLSVQVAVLGSLVWLIDQPLKKRGWPQVRYALWAVVFVKLVLPPSFALPTSVAAYLLPAKSAVVATAPVAQAASSIDQIAQPADFDQLVPSTAPLPAPVAAGRNVTAPTLLQAARANWKAILMLLWAGGVLTLSLWLIVRLFSIRRLIRSATAAPEWSGEALSTAAKRIGMRRLPRVVATDRVKSAAVFGLVRPVILVPASWEGQCSRAEKEHILLHELAHIRRGDLLVNAVLTLLHVTFWFNPAIWLAGSRTRELGELCCDASVARILGDETAAYRDTLIEAGQRVIAGRSGFSLGLLGLFENPRRFSQRLDHLSRPLWKHRRLQVASSVAVFVAMCLLFVPMARSHSLALKTEAAARAGQLATIAAAVVNENGTPASGVGVTAYAPPFTKLSPVKTTTGIDGSFRMEVPVREGFTNWGIIARAGKRISLYDVLVLPDGRVSILPGRMRLTLADAVAAGTVVDSGGKPIRGVTVWVSSLAATLQDKPGKAADIPDLAADQDGFLPMPTPLGKSWTVTTKRDGTFTIKGLPRGYKAYLTFMGTKLGNINLAFAPGTGPVKVTMLPEARVTGRITAEAEFAEDLKTLLAMALPYEGTVWLESTAPGEKSLRSRNPLKDGSFSFEALPPGEYRAYLKVKGWSVSTSVQPEKMSLNAGQKGTVEIKLLSHLRPAAPIQLLTTVFDVGDIARGASEGDALARSVMAAVDKDVWNAPPYRCQVSYMDEGRLIVHAPQATCDRVKEYIAARRATLTASPASVENASLASVTAYSDSKQPAAKASNPGSIHGRVVCSDARTRLNGISVRLQRAGLSTPDVDSTATTGSDGSFVMEAVPAGDYVLVAIEPEDKLWVCVPWSRVKVEAGKDGQATVEIASPVVVRGRIVDKATHEPLPPGVGGFDAEVQSTDNGVHLYSGITCDSGTDGAFEARLAPREWTVGGWIRSDSGSIVRDRESERSVEVKAGADMTLPDIEVALPGKEHAREQESPPGIARSATAGGNPQSPHTFR